MAGPALASVRAPCHVARRAESVDISPLSSAPYPMARQQCKIQSRTPVTVPLA